jgi:hypothetical protein
MGRLRSHEGHTLGVLTRSSPWIATSFAWLGDPDGYVVAALLTVLLALLSGIARSPAAN